jgi:hypothetical protein
VYDVLRDDADLLEIQGNLLEAGVQTPSKALSYLVAKNAGAKDWWFGTEISATAEGAQKL